MFRHVHDEVCSGVLNVLAIDKICSLVSYPDLLHPIPHQFHTITAHSTLHPSIHPTWTTQLHLHFSPHHHPHPFTSACHYLITWPSDTLTFASHSLNLICLPDLLPISILYTSASCPAPSIPISADPPQRIVDSPVSLARRLWESQNLTPSEME